MDNLKEELTDWIKVFDEIDETHGKAHFDHADARDVCSILKECKERLFGGETK